MAYPDDLLGGHVQRDPPRALGCNSGRSSPRRSTPGCTPAPRAGLAVDANHVGKWERGENRWPRQHYRDALRAVLEVASDSELGFFVTRSTEHPIEAADCVVGGTSGADTILVTNGLWDQAATEALSAFLTDQRSLGAQTARLLAQVWRVTEPPQILEIQAGRRVGARLAAMVLERTDALRRMDDSLGGGDLHDLVRRELRSTISLVREASYTEPVGRQLLGAVGQLCQLAGWVASDAGLYLPAERYYVGGVSAAHAAGDQPLAANLLSSLSYQMASMGDRCEAVLLATSAAQGAGPAATATTRALLGERVAWAQARVGNPQATLRALGQVDEAYADRDPEADPIWVYWLDRDEIDVMAGRCLTELKRPEPAIGLLSRAVERYDDSHARELALYLSWLAEAQVYAGHIDEAATVAARALGLSSTVTSARGTDRIRLIRGLLAPYRGTAAVDEFDGQATAILGSGGSS